MQSKHIIPGIRAVEVISAQYGTIGERILRAIASPAKEDNPENRREFGPWNENACKGVVCFMNGTRTEFPVTLKLGVREGLFIEEVPGERISYKDCGLVLQVGKSFSERRIVDAANQIAALWCIHGFHWTNRIGEVCNWPYGNDVARPVDPKFKVLDGSKEGMTLRQLIEAGGVRSTHVGQWNRPFSLVPAVCGMPIHLHEFKQTSADVSVFRTRRISNDSVERWGGYLEWSERSLGEGVDPALQALADRAASPFSFHVHATRARFPNCSLASAYFLRKIGLENVERMFRLIMLREPERAYRMIDENGVTRRLVHVTDDVLEFEGGRTMPRRVAWENLSRTFQEMASVEEDITFALPRIPRLVLDAHFYVVAFGVAEANGRDAFHLAGSEMHRYLTQGADADAHRVRNHRLFDVVRDVFNVDSLSFHVFPGIASPNGENQYTVDLARADRAKWLDTVLA